MTTASDPIADAGDLADPLEAILSFNAEPVTATPRAYTSSMALVKSGAAFEVMLEDLHVLPDFNPRVKSDRLKEHIERLAQSMMEEGFMRDKPLTVIAAFKGKKPIFYLADGHCRYAAVMIAVSRGAPIQTVHVVVKDQSTTMEDLNVAVVRSNDSLPLSPIELAVVCKRLVNAGWSYAKIATKIGVTSVYVGQLMKIIGAPRAVRERVQRGTLSVGAALALLRKHGENVVDVVENLATSPEKKTTSRHIPEVRRVNTYKRYSPQLYSVLDGLRSHTVFETLPAELKQQISGLLDEISAKATMPESVNDPAMTPESLAA